MRTFKLHDNRVTYVKLEPFRNHNATCYKERICGAHLCSREWVKKARGWMWKITGYAI